MGQGQSGISYDPNDNPITPIPGIGHSNPVPKGGTCFRLVDKNARRYYLKEDNSVWLSLGAHANILTETIYPEHLEEIICYFFDDEDEAGCRLFYKYLSNYHGENNNVNIDLFLKNNDLVKVYSHIMNKINELERKEQGCAFAIYPDIEKCLFSKMNYPTGSLEDIDQFMDDSTKILESPVYQDFDGNYDNWKRRYVFFSEYLIFLETFYEPYFVCMIQMITDTPSRYLYITISKVLYSEYFEIVEKVKSGSMTDEERAEDKRRFDEGLMCINFDWFNDSIKDSIGKLVTMYGGNVETISQIEITEHVQKIKEKLQQELVLFRFEPAMDLSESSTLEDIYLNIYGQLTKEIKTRLYNLDPKVLDNGKTYCMKKFSETWSTYRSFYSVIQISENEGIQARDSSIISKIEAILNFLKISEQTTEGDGLRIQFRDGLVKMKEICEFIFADASQPTDDDDACYQIIEYMKTKNSHLIVRLTSFEFYSIFMNPSHTGNKQRLIEYHPVLQDLFLDNTRQSLASGRNDVYMKAPFSSSSGCVVKKTVVGATDNLNWARAIRTLNDETTLHRCPSFLNRIICQHSNPSIEKYGEYRCVFVGDDVAMIFDLATRQIVYCSKKYMEIVATELITRKQEIGEGPVPQLFQLGRITDGYYNYRYLTDKLRSASERKFRDWPSQPTSQTYCSAFNTFKSKFVTPLIEKCKELSRFCEGREYTAYKYSRMDFVMNRDFGGFSLVMPPCSQFILNEIEDGSFGTFSYDNNPDFLPRTDTKGTIPEADRVFLDGTITPWDDRGPMFYISPPIHDIISVFPTLYMHYEKDEKARNPAREPSRGPVIETSADAPGRAHWRHPEIYHSRIIFGYMKGFVNSFTQNILRLFQLGEDYTGIIQEHFYEIYLVFAYYSQNKHPEDFVDQHSFDAHPEPPEFPTFLDRVLIEKYPDIQRQSDESDGKLALRIFETVYKPRTKSAIKQLSDFPYYEDKGVYPLEFKVELYDNPYMRDSSYIIGKFLLRQQESQGQTASGYSRKKRRTARKRKTKRKQTKRRRVKQRKQTKRRRTRTKRYN
jgi:hypothetical protein